jgi:hypothetical protein
MNKKDMEDEMKKIKEKVNLSPLHLEIPLLG